MAISETVELENILNAAAADNRHLGQLAMATTTNIIYSFGLINIYVYACYICMGTHTERLL